MFAIKDYLILIGVKPIGTRHGVNDFLMNASSSSVGHSLMSVLSWMAKKLKTSQSYSKTHTRRFTHSQNYEPRPPHNLSALYPFGTKRLGLNVQKYPTTSR